MMEIIKDASIQAAYIAVIVFSFILATKLFISYMDDKINFQKFLLSYTLTAFIFFMFVIIVVENEKKSHPKELLPVHNQNNKNSGRYGSTDRGSHAKRLPYFINCTSPSGACGTWSE